MESFGRSRARDWIAAAKDAYGGMRSRHNTVSVVGLSMGGALGVILASERHEIPALVLIAPYLGMPVLLRAAAATHWLWARLAGEVNARNPRSIRDPIEREKNLAYGAVTGRELHELSEVVSRARKALKTSGHYADRSVTGRPAHRAGCRRIRSQNAWAAEKKRWLGPKVQPHHHRRLRTRAGFQRGRAVARCTPRPGAAAAN